MTHTENRTFTPDMDEQDFTPETLPKGYKAQKGGIYFLTPTKDKDGAPIDKWVFLCSDIQILAKTANAQSKDNGLLVKIKAPSNTWHELALPAELWANDGRLLREILANHGATLSNSTKAKNALLNLFSLANPKEKALCVSRIGWHRKTFVFPDQAIGKEAVGRVVYQSATPEKHPYNQSGTLEEWKNNIAAFAVGNSRLVGGISISLAVPLLNLVHMESGGFGVYGASSRGKTTMLEVAGSVWGGGGISGYIKSWRATDNGLEGVAASRCDALLPLDELGQVSPWAVANASYMLANGQGKVRANKAGQAQAVAEWRILFLSSGEISLSQKIAQDKKGSKIMAGQKVRFLDFPMDGGANMGLFEECHGFEPSRFANMLKDNVQKYYGTAARAFIQKLVSQDWQELQEQIKTMQAAFVDTNARQMDGLVQRAAARFGLIAVAGELATRWGITGWKKGEASSAAVRLFQDWLANHGSATVPTEVIDGVKQVQSFLESHGASKFAHWDSPTTSIIDRCGFYKNENEKNVFYIFANAWTNKVCNGFDSQAVAATLAEKGVLEQENGRPSKTIRLPDKSRKRVYILDMSKLDSDIFLQDNPHKGGDTGDSGDTPNHRGFERHHSKKTGGDTGDKSTKTAEKPQNVTSVTTGKNEVVTAASPNHRACHQRHQCHHPKQDNPYKNNVPDQPDQANTTKPKFNHGSV